MSEKLTPAPMMYEESIRPVDQLYHQAVDSLAHYVPEIQEKREALDVASQEIVSAYDIQPTFFEDQGRVLAFMGVADRWAAQDPHVENGDESQFLDNVITLLAKNHSLKLGAAKKGIDDESSVLSDAGTLAVYERYTDVELSAAVTEKIRQGDILGETKRKLGITEDNEDPYEVRVFSIGSDHDAAGMDAPQPDYGLPFGHPDLVGAEQTLADVKAWKMGLEKRSASLATELGRESLFAPAWVTTLEGRTMLCISSPLAEKILDKDIVKNSPYYDDKRLQDELSMLDHEYTHTQGGLNLDNEVGFGINLEELRAEHFAGDKQGYADIKGLFRDYRIVTGHDLKAEFDARIKGGSSVEIFGSIANRIGLQKMLELVMAAPNNYISAQSNKHMREAHAYIGGFDGVLGRILEQEIRNGNGPAAEERITEAAQRVIDVVSRPGATLDVESVAQIWRSRGLNVLTDLIEQRAQALLAA